MTRIAYTVEDVPAAGMGAFTPVPAMTGSAATCGVWDRQAVFGGIPTPGPALRGTAPGGCPTGGGVQGSWAGPTAGLPGAFPAVPDATRHEPYWNNRGGYGEATMKRVSDNPLPVPAVNPGRTPTPAWKVPPFGTVVSTAWPRPYISWPTWGTSRQQ